MIHKPQQKQPPRPQDGIPPEVETEKEAAQRSSVHEERMAEYKAEQEPREEERKADFEHQQKEYEAE
jgi:ParB family chromosome partitioning protein